VAKSKAEQKIVDTLFEYIPTLASQFQDLIYLTLLNISTHIYWDKYKMMSAQNIHKAPSALIQFHPIIAPPGL